MIPFIVFRHPGDAPCSKGASCTSAVCEEVKVHPHTWDTSPYSHSFEPTAAEDGRALTFTPEEEQAALEFWLSMDAEG
jgi:hypothetical protein